MALNKICIGDCIELYNEACGNPNLTIFDVSGVNRDKDFFSPSKTVGADTSKYKVVPPNYFACNLMHVGRDVVLPIALNTTKKNIIVTSAYSVFKIINEDELLKEYFIMLLKSPEKDRNFWFHTDSSVRDGMSWNDFCSIKIEVPSVEIQRKYVAVYNAMIENQKAYEQGLDDLLTTCIGYVEDLRKKLPLQSIKKYIAMSDEKNDDESHGIDDVKGVSINKELIETKADMEGVNLKPYLIIKPNYFAYVTVTSRNGEKISLALNDSENTYICSSSYIVFYCKDECILYPKYLRVFFGRSEFNRYARFNSWGSARETFDWKDMCEVKMPIPDIETQKAIGNIFAAYTMRKEINEQLKAQIKDICPILIRGSLDEARV